MAGVALVLLLALGACAFFLTRFGPLAGSLAAFLLFGAFMMFGAGQSVVESVFAGVLMAGCLLVLVHKVDSFRLRRDGVPVEAEVTGWEQSSHHGRGSHAANLVRYAFTVPGRPESFSATDFFPFVEENAWVDIPRDLWEQTRQTRKLRVVYLPSDPRKNRPE